MAFIQQRWCNICKNNRSFLNGECVNCKDRKFREQRAIWDSKTLEEKIEVLLERIEKLEAGPLKYS